MGRCEVFFLFETKGEQVIYHSPCPIYQFKMANTASHNYQHCFKECKLNTVSTTMKEMVSGELVSVWPASLCLLNKPQQLGKVD